MTARRYRRIVVASAATLGISVTLLGLIGFIHGWGRQALQTDTGTAIEQASEQLLRGLQSRRGTLTFIRDALNRRADLSGPQLSAIGASAVKHTRQLLGTGLIQAGQHPVWWSAPDRMPRASMDQLNRAIIQRTRLKGIWRVPSTFVTTTPPDRKLMVMLEPLRTSALPQSAVIGVFDIKPLFEDFFASGLPARYPVRLLDGETVLYRSEGWRSGTPRTPAVVSERAITLDAARWTLQLQPGRTRVVQTLSWLNILITALGAVAGLGVIAIIWILSARTVILQRAVQKRTSALRRALVRVRQMAITDELTGLYNRRFFLKRWDWECERAKRYQRPLACLMIDVNGFKLVNDRLGHQMGDLVLKQVSQELKAAMRQSDILARLGGDEFVIALPETSPTQAALVAEKLSQLIIRMPDGHGQAASVSLSVGMSRVEQNDDSPEEILDAADKSLYAHKLRQKASLQPADQPA